MRGSDQEYIMLRPVTDTSSVEDVSEPDDMPVVLRQKSIGSAPFFSRRSRFARFWSYPLLLLFLYVVFTLLIPKPHGRAQIEFDFAANAGRSALDSTISLPRIQHSFSDKAGNEQRRQKVREELKRTWDAYVQQAWGWDEVKPVSGGGRDTRNGWGATIVDGLSTLLIAGLDEEFLAALNYTLYIDFTTADGLVNPFETIIRYVGAMVSTIDLLEYYPNAPKVDPAQIEKLKAQALTLVHKLSPGLDSPTRMWYPRIDFDSEKGVSTSIFGDTEVSLAETGTNILEYGRLSEISQSEEYINNATAAWWPLVQPAKEPVLPGLISSPVSLESGLSIGKHIEWGSGHDSFYEYLIKAFVLWPNNKTQVYSEQWKLATQSTIKYLWSTSLVTPDVPSHLFLGTYDGHKSNEMSQYNPLAPLSHKSLTCFAPGNFLLGGIVLQNETVVEFGLRLLEGCWHVYAVSPSGIGPETWRWKSHDLNDHPKADNDRVEWTKLGFWSTNKEYYLRPETIESLFYAYRITGKKLYQDRAWEAFEHILSATKAPYGCSSVENVMKRDGAKKRNEQESFWIAETLKYLYLIFSDEDVISLDDWVLTTEGQPLKRGRQVQW